MKEEKTQNDSTSSTLEKRLFAENFWKFLTGAKIQYLQDAAVIKMIGDG